MKARSLAACLILFALLALAGCAVEDDPAPALIDPSGLVTYAHPTGTFTIDLPPDWVVRDTSDDATVRAAFSPPGSPVPLIGVTVLDTRVLEVAPSVLAALPDESQAVPGRPDGVIRAGVGREHYGARRVPGRLRRAERDDASGGGARGAGGWQPARGLPAGSTGGDHPAQRLYPGRGAVLCCGPHAAAG